MTLAYDVELLDDGGGEVDADLIASARIVYLEGYLFDQPEAKAAFRQAADIAATSTDAEEETPAPRGTSLLR